MNMKKNNFSNFPLGKKKIILGLVFLVILCGYMFLVYADTGRQVKTILRKSLFEHFQHPIKTTLNRSEVIDLIVVYLEGDITDDALDVAREHSGKSVRSIINKAINNYGTEPECVDQCGDGDCAAVVCTGTGCPCWETAETCPEDCGDECTIDEDCEAGQVCTTNGECEDVVEPDECSPEGVKECSEDGISLKTCSADPGNLGRLMWGTETCPYGCESGACNMIPLTCGNDAIDPDEECDGIELGGATCLNVSPHFIGGNLSCLDCKFDASFCERNDSSNWQYPGGTVS